MFRFVIGDINVRLFITGSTAVIEVFLIFYLLSHILHRADNFGSIVPFQNVVGFKFNSFCPT